MPGRHVIFITTATLDTYFLGRRMSTYNTHLQLPWSRFAVPPPTYELTLRDMFPCSVHCPAHGRVLPYTVHISKGLRPAVFPPACFTPPCPQHGSAYWLPAFARVSATLSATVALQAATHGGSTLQVVRRY